MNNHCSYKYKKGKTEVDLYYPRGLLLATITHKKDSDHNVDKVFKDKEITRILTMEEDYKYQYTGKFHKIAYPQALLMCSDRTVYRLEPNKIDSDAIIGFAESNP